MSEPQVFYRALDPVKGSWDGYGYFPLGETDFLAYVIDAPSGASIQTTEVIKLFWTNFCRELQDSSAGPSFGSIELADGINRLQNELIRKGRQDSVIYQSTLIVIRKTGNILHYSSIGDSFLYLYRNDRLFNLAASEVWDGALIISETQKLEERLKTGTLRMIGKGGEFVEPSSVYSMQLRQNDLLVLGSDGVQDVLPPDKWIPWLEKEAEERRTEFERAFPADRLKDDVTFMLITPEIPSVFDAEVEIAKTQASMERFEKEQIKIRGEIVRGIVAPGRLEKMEKELEDLAHQIRKLSSRAEESQKHARTSGSFSASQQSEHRTFPWIPVLIALLIGLIAGLSFFLFSRSDDTKTAAVPEKSANVSSTQSSSEVNPPEILTPADCAYTIVRGDTLEKISRTQNIPVELLLQWNPAIKRNSALKVGAQIQLCAEER